MDRQGRQTSERPLMEGQVGVEELGVHTDRRGCVAVSSTVGAVHHATLAPPEHRHPQQQI